MSTKVKKTKSAPLVDGDIDDLSTKDRLSFMKVEYATALDTLPDYSVLKQELQKYKVDLPTNPDISDLSGINKLYAMAQSFSSRITSIEVSAIDNASRWKRIVELMDDYIEDRKSEILLEEDVQELKVAQASATVRTRLKKEHKTLRKLKSKAAEADSFSRMVITKKKDLSSVLTTLGKQVKALSLDQSIHR